jgi:hypothetical protein
MISLRSNPRSEEASLANPPLKQREASGLSYANTRPSLLYDLQRGAYSGR